MAGSIASAATRSLITGTSFGDNVLATLPSAIANTVGNMISAAYEGDSVKKGGSESNSSEDKSDPLQSELIQNARKPELPVQPSQQPFGTFITGDSSIGNWLRDEFSIFGGMLGALGDVVQGTADMALGILSADQNGRLSRGVEEVAGGIGGFAQIMASDAAGTVVGLIGKVWVTTVDTVNVLTLGEMSFADRSTSGESSQRLDSSSGLGVALGRLAKDFLIPTYGLMSGANWGTTQFGDFGEFFNQADLAARMHDIDLVDRQWVRNQWKTPDQGIIPSGPVGALNAVLGAIPFWIHDGPGT